LAVEARAMGRRGALAQSATPGTGQSGLQRTALAARRRMTRATAQLA